MCEICLHNPCLPRCPNYRESVMIGRCEKCGEPLYQEHEIIEDNEGNMFCGQYCALRYHGIKEKEYD